MANYVIPSIHSHKHFGILLSNDCSLRKQIDLIKKARAHINVTKRLRYILVRKSLDVNYALFILPIMMYAYVIWDNSGQYEKDDLQKIQNEAARIVTGCTTIYSNTYLQRETGWEPLCERRR